MVCDKFHKIPRDRLNLRNSDISGGAPRSGVSDLGGRLEQMFYFKSLTIFSKSLISETKVWYSSLVKIACAVRSPVLAATPDIK